MLGMAKGVALCHRLGVVHRDINVHNFMFDGWGRVKLIDFASAAKVRACAACTHASSFRRLCVSVCAVPTPAGACLECEAICETERPRARTGP